jgi:hypothetical protein
MVLSDSPPSGSDGLGKGEICPNCGAIRLHLYDIETERLEVPPSLSVSLSLFDLPLQVPVITYYDFERALTRAHSSVGTDELQRFVEWTSEFGQDG